MIVVRDLPWVFLCYKSRPRPSQRVFLKVLLISSHLFLLYLSGMKWYGFSVICNLKCVCSFVLLARLFIFGLYYNHWAGWECIFFMFNTYCYVHGDWISSVEWAQTWCYILFEGLFSGILSESESMEIHSPPHHPKKIKKKLVEIENYMVLNLDSQGWFLFFSLACLFCVW